MFMTLRFRIWPSSKHLISVTLGRKKIQAWHCSYHPQIGMLGNLARHELWTNLQSHYPRVSSEASPPSILNLWSMFHTFFSSANSFLILMSMKWKLIANLAGGLLRTIFRNLKNILDTGAPESTDDLGPLKLLLLMFAELNWGIYEAKSAKFPTVSCVWLLLTLMLHAVEAWHIVQKFGLGGCQAPPSFFFRFTMSRKLFAQMLPISLGGPFRTSTPNR